MQLWWLYTFLRFRLALKVLWDRTSDGLEEKSDLIWVCIYVYMYTRIAHDMHICGIYVYMHVIIQLYAYISTYHPFFQPCRWSMSLALVYFLLAEVGAFWLRVPVSLPEVGGILGMPPGLGRFRPSVGFDHRFSSYGHGLVSITIKIG